MNRPMQQTFLNYSVTGQMQIVKFVTKIVMGLIKVGTVGKSREEHREVLTEFKHCDGLSSVEK